MNTQYTPQHGQLPREPLTSPPLIGHRNSAGAGGLTNEVFNLAAVIG